MALTEIASASATPTAGKPRNDPDEIAETASHGANDIAVPATAKQY